MLKSMTGYGRGEFQDESRRLRAEVKTTNHRFFDLKIKAPRAWLSLEPRIRQLVQKYVARGQVEVYFNYSEHNDAPKAIRINQELARQYCEELKALKENLGLSEEITLPLILSLREVITSEEEEEDQEALWPGISQALEAALQSLEAMRRQEGGKVAEEFSQRLASIEQKLTGITQRAPLVVEEYAQKLKERIKKLTAEQNLEAGRLEQEIAFFADRADISEECQRLSSHLQQFRAALNLSEPVGRKLDFILQEMNREANTLSSKSQDLEITAPAVAIKTEIEKIREQVQNIE